MYYRPTRVVHGSTVHGSMGPHSPWVHGPRVHVVHGPRVHGSTGPCSPWVHGPRVHGSMGPRSPWVHSPRVHGSTGSWVHWSNGPRSPWVHGSTGPRVHVVHGSTDSLLIFFEHWFIWYAAYFVNDEIKLNKTVTIQWPFLRWLRRAMMCIYIVSYNNTLIHISNTTIHKRKVNSWAGVIHIKWMQTGSLKHMWGIISSTEEDNPIQQPIISTYFHSVCMYVCYFVCVLSLSEHTELMIHQRICLFQ